MATALPIPNKITINNPKQVKHRTLEARFGDGQGQWAGKGINRKVRFYDIEWAPLSLSEKDTIEAALDTVEGYGTLLWTPCNESTELKFRLIDGEYDTTPLSQNKYKITCKLEQRFD